MNTSSPDTNADYRERLQQAVRVMQGLSEQERANNFNILFWARETEHGVVVNSIAGLCGLDPWFQERGFITDVEAGRVSMSVCTFFGTASLFSTSSYPQPETATVDDVIAALTRAIDALPAGASTSPVAEYGYN